MSDRILLVVDMRKANGRAKLLRNLFRVLDRFDRQRGEINRDEHVSEFRLFHCEAVSRGNHTLRGAIC
jgi:hypothetical protein